MNAEPSPQPDSLSTDEWELVKDIVYSCLALDGPARERLLDDRRPSEQVRR